ncbi:hypothetical protein AHAS_Ahas09G0135100 [Arachis hypogaea]
MWDHPLARYCPLWHTRPHSFAFDDRDDSRGPPHSLVKTRHARERCKIMSTYDDDVKNDSDNDLGDDFDYEPNSHDDVEDDDVDSLDFTSKSEHDYQGRHGQSCELSPQRSLRSKVKNKDANAAINYMIGKSNNDSLFFGKYTFTNDQRLEHIFWADGQSIVDYHCFGDIVAFDSAYKKNKYNKPLVIFSGCNHHGQTVIFGSGLVSDEMIEHMASGAQNCKSHFSQLVPLTSKCTGSSNNGEYVGVLEMLCLLNLCFPLSSSSRTQGSSYGKLYVGGSPLSMATIRPLSENGLGALSSHS